MAVTQESCHEILWPFANIILDYVIVVLLSESTNLYVYTSLCFLRRRWKLLFFYYSFSL